MLNAARPYMDVNLDRQGLPVAVTPRDFFAFLEAVTTYNNRTPALKDKALVLEGMASRVIDFCAAFPSLRFKPQEGEDDDEQQTLLEYDSEWDPKTEAGREKCLGYDTNIIIPALRKQSRSRTARRSMKRCATCSRVLCRRRTGLTGHKCAC